MEHASIASFSRVVMQLLAMGAPPNLVHQANQALADEIRHAELCFELANAHLNQTIEPGKLSVHDCMQGQLSPVAIAMGCFEEACLGETQAFLEASEAARHCQAPYIRSVLEQIAKDERAHAIFGWRMLGWVWGQLSCTERTQATRLLQDRIQAMQAQLDASETATEPRADQALESWGKLGPARLQRLRCQALREVVLPCARALLSSDVLETELDESVARI